VKPRWRDSISNAIGSDTCGCATGAVFLGVALVVTGGWYAWHWEASRLALWATVGRIIGTSMAAAIVGKVVGILLYQRRSHGAAPEPF
jgi:uncharacterized PurR-regulated membrane protein YhhQ (DUF165 family)